MSNLRTFMMLTIISLVIACSMPGTRIYTIHSPVQRGAGHIRSGVSIVINVGSKDYLRQPYIASRDSVYRLSIAKYSKWELSPARILRKEYKKAFSTTDFFKDVRTANIALKNYYRLKIYLKGFERLDKKDGMFGLLEFDITLLDPDGMKLYSDSVSREGALEGTDFIHLARVLSGLLQSEIEKSKTHIFGVLGNRIKASGQMEMLRSSEKTLMCCSYEIPILYGVLTKISHCCDHYSNFPAEYISFM